MPIRSISRFTSLLVVLFSTALPLLQARQQIDPVSEAKAAITSGDYNRAVPLLSAAIAQAPSADASLYLGIAYAHTREPQKAEETLRAGGAKYPQDPRFPIELANLYLARNDLDRAREFLVNALAIEPKNIQARDLLATLDLSMGNVEVALDGWNKDDKPVVGDILHNTHLQSENWVVDRARAFDKDEKLTWPQWRTTEMRLWETKIFSNVGLDIEPTTRPDRYTALVRTTTKTNSVNSFVVPLLEALVLKKPSLDWWNLGNSAASLNASYRFATNRHRAEAGIFAPLPVAGLLFLDAQGIYRSERWDVSRPAIDSGVDPRFRFKSTGFRVTVRHIPNHRVEFGGGIEYRRRSASGAFSGLALDSNDTAKLLGELRVLTADDRYRSRIQVEVFAAQEEILGDMSYRGGTVEWSHQYLTDGAKGFVFDLSLKGGASRGEVPVDDYFVLGVGDRSASLLRGHNVVTSRGNFGNAPMGTGFALANATLDRRIRRLPFFGVLDVPYLDLKWEVFADAAKTFDRARVFEQGKIWIDVGAGFKIETPTRAVHLTYGRSLRNGTGTFAVYVLKLW